MLGRAAHPGCPVDSERGTKKLVPLAGAQNCVMDSFHHEGHEEHEGVKGTAHRSTPTILGPGPGVLQLHSQLPDSVTHRIPFFVSFVLFVVNSLWYPPRANRN